jgi:hypothetical protein
MSECIHCGADAGNYCDDCDTSYCDGCQCRCNDEPLTEQDWIDAEGDGLYNEAKDDGEL